MRPPDQARPAAAAGFTVLEVLVASAILGIVMMVLLSTLTTSLALWRNTENKALADREARGAELMLVEDMSGVVMMPAPDLWPRVAGGGANNVLQFLTTKPSDYLPAQPGDIFFVEYWVDPETLTLRRAILDSRRTYDTILRGGSFPAPRSVEGHQMLASNLLPENKAAARGLTPQQRDEANNTNFVLLDASLLPFTGTPATNNIPAAVEVNFAVADPDVLRDTNALGNAGNVLRNAGLYSTRFRLPRPIFTP
jgi:prepilin-type N-terminal cleavage/methylation domain-containing protein